MSSNSNHINITRSNYEEYLLLYVDNELSPADKAAVEAFLQLHPDLQTELELLQAAVLPAEEFTINKQGLLADSMALNSIDENLLLYIDDELPRELKTRVALQIEENTTTLAQYHLLLKTKLDSSETIVYPYKEALYRTTKRRAIEWLQIAAAVLIVAMGGWFWMQSSQTASRPSVNIASAAKQTTATGSRESTTQTITQTPKIAANTIDHKAESSPSVAVAKSKIKKREQEQKLMIPVVNTTANRQTDVADVPVQRTNTIGTAAVINTASTPEQIINTSLVTSAPALRTIYKEPVTEDNNSSSKSPFKALLRKATRFIERRTGITTTNENNEVLIASVAVSLN